MMRARFLVGVAACTLVLAAACDNAGSDRVLALCNIVDPGRIISPDLAVAAETLGITEQELMAALGPPPPDLAAAAQTLGITEQELQNALFPAGTAMSEPPADQAPESDFFSLIARLRGQGAADP